jgi:hypothetical protein
MQDESAAVQGSYRLAQGVQGQGHGANNSMECWLASDASAVVEHTKR